MLDIIVGAGPPAFASLTNVSSPTRDLKRHPKKLSRYFATFEGTQIAVFIVAGLAAIPLFWVVHRLLNWVCIFYVKRYCRVHDIEISVWRISPVFDQTGIKTEMTQIEVFATGDAENRKAYRFIVWAFGIKEVSDIHEYSEAE